jgi:hypothetical protein
VTRGWKIGLAILGGLVALNVVLHVVNSLSGGTPGGPTSSAYATGRDGLAGYDELLRRARHRVRRIRESAPGAKLDPGSTAVLLDPVSFSARDGRALRRFVQRGGRLITGGADAGWLVRVLPDAPEWSADAVRSAHRLAPLAELERVNRVRTAGEGAWTRAATALPLFGSGRRSVVVLATIGRGRAFLLADASPLQNRLLDRADNAALGLGVAGAPTRPVVFLERYHGYGRASGLGAIPARWWFAFAGIGAAALAFMLARGRRLGPPEPEARELPPPRREYVDSLGGVLARTRMRAEAIEPVRKRVRERLAERPQRSVDDATRRALEGEIGSDADVLEVGRTLARLEREHV